LHHTAAPRRNVPPPRRLQFSDITAGCDALVHAPLDQGDQRVLQKLLHVYSSSSAASGASLILRERLEEES
jgi:hypothetical protein